MPGVDEAVEQLERLYRSVTGKPAPSGHGAYTPIPPEKDAVRHVQEQLDRLLQVLGRPFLGVEGLVPWTPRLTVWDGEHDALVQLELAGVPRESLSVSFAQGVLHVSGWRPLPATNGDRPTLRATEMPMGPFARSIPLPPETSEIRANLKDGMLELRVRRATSAAPGAAPATRSIPVK